MNRNAPECPFCGRIVDRPDEIKTGFGSLLGGSCQCGAVYVCDPTGHNTGEAYSDALALAKGDWQVSGMDEDRDYEAVDIDYDEKSHQRVYSGGNRSLSGRLVFVKLKMDSGIRPPGRADGTGSAGMTQEKTAEKKMGTHPHPVFSSGMKIKDRVRGLLELRAYDEIAQMAAQDKGVIKSLISLSYDKEDVMSWRAIEAFGIISRTFAKERMDVLRDTVRRLLWSMGEESGGIGWSAAEILGEIVAADPDAFNDIVPIIWSFKEEEMFRAGILWAMGRIAMIRPDLVEFIMKDLPEMLEDADPAVRGHAVVAMGILNGILSGELIPKLLEDHSAVPFYKNGDLLTITVGELARETLHKAAK